MALCLICAMIMPTIILVLFSAAVLAGEQEPIGSKTSWSVTTNNNQIVFHMHNDTSGSNWTVNGGSVPIALPYVYKDEDSGTVYYVETDGRHVSAIGSDGKILWSRDPFADAHLPLYRTKAPRIVFFKREKDCLAIAYNSTQSGTLNIKTGDFTFEGQN